MARNYFNNNNKICHHHQQQKFVQVVGNTNDTKTTKNPKDKLKKTFPRLEGGLRLHLLARFFWLQDLQSQIKILLLIENVKWGQIAFRRAWIIGNSAGIRAESVAVSHIQDCN